MNTPNYFGDLPTITNSNTGMGSSYNLCQMVPNIITNTGSMTSAPNYYEWEFQQQADNNKKEEVIMSSQRRIVQVFIADPNENVPLEQSLLYSDPEPKLTDLTDQELFFELDIKSILEQHNTARVKLVDKKASSGKGENVMLEPVKVRDLKMTVVTVAQF
jgi:hypothetical protein